MIWCMRFLLARLSAFGAFIDRRPFLVLAFGLAIYCFRSFTSSQSTPMIPDELLTYVQAQLPTLDAVWTTLKTMPATVDPPLNPAIAFFALRLPFPPTLSLRLPAIVWYGAMMLGLFVLVKRRAPPVVALLAFALPMVLPISSFSIQSRPYALWLGAAGWALVCWQGARDRPRALSLAGLYVCLTVAILAQYVGSLIFLPLIAGELWRTRRNGLDLPVWLTFLAAGASLLAYAPLLKASSVYRLHPWHGVVPRDLEDTFMLGISAVAVGLIALAVAAHLLTKESAAAPERQIVFPPEECIALTALYAIPLVMFVAAILVTHSYVPRYSILFGMADACFLAVLLFELTKRVPGLAACMLMIVFLRALPPRVSLHFPQQTNGVTKAVPAAFEKFPGLPIAVPLWDPYLRIYLDGPDELKKRMLLVWDPDRLTEFGNNGSLANQAVQRALHAPFAFAPEFFRSHRDFVLVGSYALRNRLLDKGWTIAWLGSAYGLDIYRATAAR